MLALSPVQPKGARDRTQHMGTDIDRAPLFEPRVPGDADPRQLGNLLTPESGSTPTGSGR